MGCVVGNAKCEVEPYPVKCMTCEFVEAFYGERLPVKYANWRAFLVIEPHVWQDLWDFIEDAHFKMSVREKGLYRAAIVKKYRK